MTDLYGGAHNAVNVRVDKRLLWVGNAAYPLRNITRVYTFLLRPNRGAALARFMRRLLVLLAVVVVLAVLDDGRSEYVAPTGEEGLVVFGAGFAIFAVLELLAVLFARSVPVLAVDTAGSPTAIVTDSDRGRVGELLHTLAYALEHPETEFQVTMQTLTFSPQNYHVGDNVNMYGGFGNTGKVTN
ncbi:DUF6232 family protein [Kitasatospora purpeofusca]|uniref:DUF6232 family protein n=1 Tax=Kitasatospora purpeofusca TaxID=67352 RepID=UPI002A5AC6E5|nr:DUF6232 family protein [Kitasatospora purpeofusca]MDY0812997.1 DUF6232 family protein [Kitasatospora purpeofusca]